MLNLKNDCINCGDLLDPDEYGIPTCCLTSQMEFHATMQERLVIAVEALEHIKARIEQNNVFCDSRWIDEQLEKIKDKS